MITNMNEYIQLVKENITKAQEYQAQNANKKKCDIKYKIGDQVLLSTANLNLASQVQRLSRKFQVRFIGLYLIKEQVSTVSYRLTLPATLRIHPVFHVSLLKPYHQGPHSYSGRTPQPSAPILVEDYVEYEVEKILDKRTRYNHIEYLVKWLGYPEYDSTWEPLRNLKNAQFTIYQFEHSQ